MPIQLLALTDGPSILLDKPILLLGRHPECDIQLNSRKVSRRHCCIAQVRDYLVVRDLGSTNGVRINGNRVLEGKLKSGDELTVGNFKYQISLDGANSVVPPLPSTPPVKKGHFPVLSKPVDQLLEDAEEPIALSESAASGVIDAKPANPQAKPKPSRPASNGTIPEDPLIPSQLELIRNSGSSISNPK